MQLKPTLLLALLIGGTSSRAFAHSIWIERLAGSQQLVARFAEPTGNLERSPGHLDSLTPPTAFILVTNAPVVVEASKQTNHFRLAGASVTNAAFVETSFTVRNGRKPLFYARWQPAGAGVGKPLLTMDLVPTGKPGEARLYLRGKPHGNVKATLLTPTGEEKEFPVDVEGFVRVPAPQPGLHLLTVAHQREPIPGIHLGVDYTETSHNCALAWEQK